MMFTSASTKGAAPVTLVAIGSAVSHTIEVHRTQIKQFLKLHRP